MALSNFMGKRKWKAQFEAGREAADAGDLESALANLKSALEHAVGISERDSSYGDTALLLGQVYRRLKQYDLADEMSKKSFEYYESIFGVTDPRTVQAHLAIVLSQPGRSHPNMDVRKATYELARDQFKDESWQAVRTAALALPAFTSQEREKVYALAQAACSAILGENRIHLATWPPVAEEFGEALAQEGNVSLAAKFFAVQLRINEERFGDKSQEASLARLRLGEIFLQKSEPQKAEVALGKAIEFLKLKIGPKSSPVQRGTVAMARALARQKKLGAAAPFLTEALTLLRPDQVEERLECLVAMLEFKCLIAGTDSERGALWQELESLWERATDDSFRQRIFAGLLAAQNRLQQAWELQSADRFLHAVLARVRQWRGAHHPDVAEVMMAICACYTAADDTANALSYLEQSLALDEGLDNLIRVVGGHARMGDVEKAKQRAHQANRLLKALPQGAESGRRQMALARALLHCGEIEWTKELCLRAEKQLAEHELAGAKALRAEALTMSGRFIEATGLLKEAVSRLWDPFDKARALLHLAWLLVRNSEFTEAKEVLSGTETFVALRSEHPVAYEIKAVSAQIAFYSGDIFEGREYRDGVLDFLRVGGHQGALRSLPIMALIEPFGRDEAQMELDLGTDFLAICDFPQRNLAVFPVMDVACLGLRHVTRALEYLDQPEIAQERFSQYEQRFLDLYPANSPLRSAVFLTAATVATTIEEKCAHMEAAVPGLRALAEQHVSLFPTLSRLTELCLELGDVGKARSCCQAALDLRRSAKLSGWLESLEKGVLPHFAKEKSSVRSQEWPGEDTEEVTVDEVSVPDFQEVSRETNSDDEVKVVVAAGGTSDLGQLKLAKFLSERAEAPTPEEAEEFLLEVKARFGTEVSPNLEARVLLALLFPEETPEAKALWKEALGFIEETDFAGLLELENRAREANSWDLVLQTLHERLVRETERFGENGVETLETQMRLARAYESNGQLQDSYRRFTMITEILRSWFGARSRRLLEPLGELIRVAESLNDVQAAYEHQLEHHRLLEASEGDSEELFNSRISLLPIRGRLGQMTELLEEALACEQELIGFRGNAPGEFVRVLLVTAKRVDQLHWRCDVAATLLEIALRVLPEQDVSLGCLVRISLSECLFRKDYRSQATKTRQEAVEKANSLEADARAEMLLLAAQSCLRIQEIGIARELAERILEERIAEVGRKDLWAGRALLVLAEADLRTYRLEGTETAISMSAPSLQGTRYWAKAMALKLQALFFLNRFEESNQILEKMPPERSVDLRLQLAVWYGQGAEYVRQFTAQDDSLLSRRWIDFETVPLDKATNTLEFFARCGQVKLLAEGLRRLRGRTTGVVQTDPRYARLKMVESCSQFWESDWEGTAESLQRTLELIPEGTIDFPEGLTANLIREAMLTCLLMDGRSAAALAQAQKGVAEAAELLGEEDVRAMAFKVGLAQCARALGHLDDSLVLLDEILTPLQDVLGETHVLLRDVFRGLASTFLDQEDLESARMSAEEALRIDKECRGLSIQLVQDLELLADIEAKDDIPEALNLLDTAQELAQQVLPPDHAYDVQLSLKRDSLALRLEQAGSPIPHPEAVSPQFELKESPSDESQTLAQPEADLQAAELQESLAQQKEPAALREETVEVARLEETVDSADALFTEFPVDPDVSQEVEVMENSEQSEISASTLFADDNSKEKTVPQESEMEVSEKGGVEGVPRPYKTSAKSEKGPLVSTSSAIDRPADFPPPPMRLPHISEPEIEEEGPPDEPSGEMARSGFQPAATIEPSSEEILFSTERILEISDPESFLLPLAPVFFLPVPWKEATEASFDDVYEELYKQFQKTFKKGVGWRPVVEDAVSFARRRPCHSAGYFLFLLGAQLEKGGHLHTADVCLATAIELLETGAPLGAACHLAGRVAGRRGELKRALEYFERSAELAGEAELAVLKIDAAECHLGLGRPEEALIGFEEVFDYLAENAPKVQALAVQAKMAQIHLLIGDPDTSQVLAEQTKESLSPGNAGTYRVLGRILLSRAFARLGRLELATELAEQAWEGAKPWSAKRKDGRRIAISNLVDIYSMGGRFEESLELLYESGLTGWGLAEVELLLRAGHVSCSLGRLQDARRYLRLGKSFLSRFRSPALWRSCFLELEAEIRVAEGDYQQASIASDKALELFEQEATGPVDRSRHIVRAAKIAAALGQREKARNLIEQAYSLRDLHLGAEHPHTSSIEGLSAILSE